MWYTISMNIYLKIVLVIVVIVLLYVVFEVVRITPHYTEGRRLADNAIPFQREVGEKSVVVFGDSTSVGTGASSSEKSFVGLVASQFPDYSFNNVGFNGAKVDDLEGQLEKIGDEKFDRAIVLVGGNDVLYFTSTEDAKKELQRVLPKIHEKADSIILMNGLRGGRFHAFPFIFQDLYVRRTHAFQEMYREIETDFSYVDYFDMSVSLEGDIFVKESEKMHSTDTFHPSDAGYEVWLADWKRFLGERNIDF